MSNIARMMQRATAGAGGAGIDVDEVFSTYLYDGTGANLTITNGIDLSGEGGLVWIKSNQSRANALFDTERGVGKVLISNENAAQGNAANALTAFNSNGFSLGIDDSDNVNKNYTGNRMAAWTWRKAPKFFDVVTYTGTGSAQTIAHSLGTTVGMLIIKRTDSSSSDGWICYHNGFSKSGDPRIAFLNSTDEAFQANSTYLNNTYPTSTNFTVGEFGDVNASNGTYVAYLFAHNDGDGEFGPDADQDIISCGSFTGNGSLTGPSVNVGFEPQWIMIKRATGGTGQWFIMDAMRGITAGITNGDKFLLPAYNSSEQQDNFIKLTANGFDVESTNTSMNNSGDTYIYMAIRRGPLAAPDDATKVFAVANGAGTSLPLWTSNFTVDMAIQRNVSSSTNWKLASRLTGPRELKPNLTDAESGSTSSSFDYMDGWFDSASNIPSYYSWMWKRAPSYFDVVAYTGTGSGNLQISHNLGVAPEMMWVKIRSGATNDWVVYHKDLPTSGNTKKSLFLNSTSAGGYGDYFANASSVHVAPTSSVFTLGSEAAVNGSSSYNYIAYLFATVAGVSKVGSVSHTSGSTTNVDCGFSSGARFVILKASSIASQWMVFDTVRGIVSGVSPFMRLNQTGAEATSTDIIDPYSTGFAIDPTVSTATYIFYAIA